MFKCHSQIPKKAYKHSVEVVASFPFEWRLRHVQTILHRESTDFLIIVYIALLCPPLPDPVNGMVMWDSLAPGGMGTYSCNHGFILDGDHTRICGGDGSWSGVEPTCPRKFITIFSIISLKTYSFSTLLGMHYFTHNMY